MKTLLRNALVLPFMPLLLLAEAVGLILDRGKHEVRCRACQAETMAKRRHAAALALDPQHPREMTFY